MEDYYKTKLFSYQHRKLSLTEQGELLYIHVQNLKSNSLSIQGIIERSLHPQIIIKFGATLSIGEFMMPDIIAKIIKENPFANINMQVENTEILLNKMQLGEIDFALIEGTFPKTSYNYNKISTERFVCVSSPKRKESKNIKLADLLFERIIVREKGSGTRNIFEQILKSKGFKLNDFSHISEIGNINTVKQLVVQNLGISFMYRIAAQKEIEKGLLCELAIEDFNESREFNFVYLKNCADESLYKKWYNKFFL